MTHLGQIDEGLAKLDEAISHLDAPGSIDRMDAFVVAVKRKINALNDLHRFADVIPLCQRILDRLDHYEQHAKDYAEDSYRLSWSDNPNDRDRYLDFSRAQAWYLPDTTLELTKKWQTYTYEFRPGAGAVVANILVNKKLVAKDALLETVTVSAMSKASGLTVEKIMDMFPDTIEQKPKDRTLNMK